VTELGAFLLPVVPLLFLLVALLLGRYPGCDAIVRLSERLAAGCDDSKLGAPVPQPPPQAPCSFAPGGGLLIALSLAQRPPPLPA
jgi:hypothetical protein